MRRILMIYDRFPPFNVSGSARPFQFAKHLPAHGYLPSVLALEPEPSEATNAEILSELDPRIEILRAPRAVRPWLNPLLQKMAERRRRQSVKTGAVAPIPTPRPAARPAKKRVDPAELEAKTRMSGFVLWSLDWYADWCLPCVRLALGAARHQRFSLVWASAPHSTNAFAGYLVSQILRLPLVLDQRDPWTYGSNWSPRLPSTGRVEAFWAGRILRHAQRVIFTSPLTEREMQARFPGAHMTTITNGFDEREAQPLRDVHPDKCLFRYTGVLNDRRVPDVLLEGLELAAADPELARDVRLEFVGGMAGHEAKIAKHGLGELVSYRGHVPKLEAERLIRGSDVNVLLQTITTGQDVIAGKVFDYMAARKPILAVVSKSGGDAWLLERAGVGRVVSFEDPAGVARAIRELWLEWRAGGAANAKELDLTPFSCRALTGELATLFDEVLERSGPKVSRH